MSGSGGRRAESVYPDSGLLGINRYAFALIQCAELAYDTECGVWTSIEEESLMHNVSGVKNHRGFLGAVATLGVGVVCGLCTLQEARGI